MLQSIPRAYVNQSFRRYGMLVLAIVIEAIIFDQLGRRQGLPTFLSADSILNVFNRTAVFGVVAVGMTYVILTAGIDLSVGSMIAFSGVLAAKTVYWFTHSVGPGTLTPVELFAAYAFALLAGGVIGGAAGGVITRLNVAPFIVTLALMSTFRGLAYIVADGQSISQLPDTYQWLGRERLFGIPISVMVMLATFVIGTAALNHTRFGRYIYAIGGNEESARLSGVNVDGVKAAVYALSGVLAALSGVMLSSRLGAGDPKVGVAAELDIIAAVVVGGTSLAGGRGTLGGTFLGLLVISVLNTGLNWIGVESFGQQVILGIVILAAVLLDQLRNQFGARSA